MKNFYSLFFILTFFLSCKEPFEYHPNQIRLNSDEQHLTAHNLSRLASQQPGDTLHLLVMGDTQRFYDEAEDFVKKANSYRYIDFVIHQGDISDFGLTQEFRWVNDIMKRLKWPYLTVIGNHDLLANGRKVYQQMFGDFNYAFAYGHIKFVFIDTNSLEHRFNGKVPDIDWLRRQLVHQPGDSWEQAIVVSHVPPFDNDFDKKLELPFHQALKESNRVRLSLYGHIHNWQSEKVYDSTVLYHATTTLKKREFTYLKVWRDGYDIQRVAF